MRGVKMNFSAFTIGKKAKIYLYFIVRAGEILILFYDDSYNVNTIVGLDSYKY